MRTQIICTIIAAYAFQPAYADQTGKGKIVMTQGHIAPACRTVVHRENGTGTQRVFRIPAVDGDDDINAVAIAALVGGRDVEINYVPGATTGCGSEPQISYITVY
ncbi:MAG: hypothetical protein ACOY5W_05245 [Pseudomonadota bacterium]